MRPPHRSPPATSQSPLARLAPAGPARFAVIEGDGATVVAVPGRYSVSYLVLGSNKVGLFDLGSGADVDQIFDALRWLDRSVDQVCLIAPTHLHMDHVMGLDRFAAMVEVPISLSTVGHRAANGDHVLRFPSRRQLLRALPTYLWQGAPRGPVIDWKNGWSYGWPKSSNRFRAGLTEPLEDGQELGGLPGWRILHTPGHSDDAICAYHERAGFLIAGDTIRNFLGGEWNPLRCDDAAYQRSRERLLTLSVRAIFPGHGPVLQGEAVLAGLRQLPRWSP